MGKRILGFDLARMLAIFGMVIVNFKLVIGQVGSEFLNQIAHFFEGKAAATFVVLAGVGMSLMASGAIKSKNREKLKSIKQILVKRAFFLFVVGLLFYSIWPADILHYYGIYLLIGVLLLEAKSKHLIGISAGIILLYPVVFLIFNYESNWNMLTLEYANFWTFIGFFDNLFFNGFHPVLPWVAFLIFGLWLGRFDWKNKSLRKRITWISLIVFLGIQLISFYGNDLVRGDEVLQPFFSTEAMPPLPLYMLNGISIATTVIGISVALGERFADRKWIMVMAQTGQHALSIYFFHVLVGMLIPLILVDGAEGIYSIGFTLLYSLVFILCMIWFVIQWNKLYKRGPFEILMRKISA